MRIQIEAIAALRLTEELTEQSTIKEHLLQHLTRPLEKMSGRKFWTSVPNALHPFEEDVMPVLHLAQALKKRGVLDSITALTRPADEPFLYAYYISRGKRSDTGGTSFTSPRQALAGAVSEQFERYLWRDSDHLYKRSRFAAERELWSALSLDSFQGFTDEQRASFDFPQVGESTRIRWVKGTSLVSPWKSVWCPLQQVSAQYMNAMTSGQMQREPLVRSVSTTGIATYTDKSTAILRATLELIERESFAISYAHRLSPPKIDANSLCEISPEFEEVSESIEYAKLELTLLSLPTDFPAHVVAAILVDRTGKGPAFALGARAHFDPVQAALDATKEAIFVRYSLRTPLNEAALSLPDIASMRARLDFWAKPENLRHIDYFFTGPTIGMPKIMRRFADPKSTSGRLTILRRALRQKKLDGGIVDLVKGSGLESIGLHSVAVVAPGLQPLQISDDPPYLGGARLFSLPEEFGYKPAREINMLPNPFP